MGFRPIFLWWMLVVIEQRLCELLAPVVVALGYEWVGCELFSQPGGRCLRIYVDAVGGIGLDQIESVSRELAAVLDVEDPLKERYTLEVSSPGIERPLFSPKQFEAACGKAVTLRFRTPVHGRQSSQGVLVEVTTDAIMLRSDEQVQAVPFTNIKKAKLCVDLASQAQKG